MAPLSAIIGNLLDIPEPSARFLLALLSAYPIALVYRVLLAERSSTFKNIYFTLTGLWVLYYVYGVTVWHSVVDVLAVYMVLRVCGGTLLSVCLIWTITMGHLVCGYVHVVYISQVHPISWTIPHCVLVLKLVGMTYNIYDGQKKPEKLSKEMKRLAIDKMPSFFDITGFAYFFGSELVGPQIPYSRHLKFTEGRLFDWKSTPSSVPAGVQRLLIGVFYAILFAFFNQFFPMTLLISDRFMEMNFAVRLVVMVICGKVALWRYISVWLIAEGSCIVTGISYEHKKVDGDAGKGEVSWHALANINVLDFETGITLESMVRSFNLNTNNWMSWYVFKRLKCLGSRTLSWFLTMLFISLWHGVWPGYYITFTLEMLLIIAERKFITYYHWLFRRPLTDLKLHVRLPLTLAAFFVKSCFLMYPMTAFMLLEWSQCYKFMYSVNFFCHILPIGWIILYSILKHPFIKSAKENGKATKIE